MAGKKRDVKMLSIAVLCGGPSSEREVSLESGRAVHAALASLGMKTRLVDIRGQDLSELKGLVFDILFNALHGAFGEDGKLQRLLNEAGLAYTGSNPSACERAFDKLRAKALFAVRGIPTPAWTALGDRESPRYALERENLSLPVVVKPVRGGSSQGVTLVHEEKDLARGMAAAAAFDRAILIESLIRGRELTVGILDGHPLPAIELRTPREFYDYAAKYSDDRTQYLCPADLEPELRRRTEEASIAAWNAVGAEHFARIDLILSPDGTPYILEVNTIPGFTSHSLLPKAAAAAGMDFPRLCLKIVELGWERHLRLH
ncbi:MAG: D-alanine--D-alanine ligase [Planctomycetota bacterium]